MLIAVLGIDLGKNSCSLVGLDEAGAVIKRRRIRPENIPTFTKSLPACIVSRCTFPLMCSSKEPFLHVREKTRNIRKLA